MPTRQKLWCRVARKLNATLGQACKLPAVTHTYSVSELKWFRSSAAAGAKKHQPKEGGSAAITASY